MDRDTIDDLLDSLNQALDTDDSDLLSEVFSQSSFAGDNDEPNRILINGHEYIESTNLARPIRKAGGGKKTSPVWKISVELQRVGDNAKFWQCLICKKMNKSTIFTAAATSGAYRHLKKAHFIVEENKRLVRLEKRIPGVKSMVSDHWKQSQKVLSKLPTLQQAPP
jgi:hypothetical protein